MPPKTHGQSRTPLYKVWIAMRRRCRNPNDPNYEDYGGRGITICADWTDRFEAFSTWARANGYRPGLQIDRVDNDGPYDPRNCRWTSGTTNRRNTRRAVVVEAFGESKPLGAWLEDQRCAVSYSTVWLRISRGWTAEQALTTPSSRPGRRATKTHCKRGHAFTPENTDLMSNGGRACLTCRRDRRRRQKRPADPPS